MKRPKQYIVNTGAGMGVAVTFSPVEEARVLKKAARLDVTVEELISRFIHKRLRAPANVERDTSEVIALAIKGIAAPSKRKAAR